MQARYLLSSCVCLSVRLSQAGIVPKWLYAESRKQRRTVAQGLWCQKISAKFQRDYPNGYAK